jgi:hypothetical protein
MCTDKYIICKYCGKLYLYEDNHINNCKDNNILLCYSCGQPNKQFSLSQLKKENLARCMDCIDVNITHKYEKYKHLYEITEFSENLNLNKQLEYYVNNLNFIKVKECLQKGANPNYCRQAYCIQANMQKVLLYNKDGSEIEEDDDNLPRPKTPLRLCIFFLSNVYLKEMDIYCIFKLLIKFGANKLDAFTYYKKRYDINNPLLRKVEQNIIKILSDHTGDFKNKSSYF